jgi:hypothetical protein
MKKKDKFIGGLALLGGAISLCISKDENDVTPCLKGISMVIRPDEFIDKYTANMEPRKKILIRKTADKLIKGFMGIDYDED